MSMEMASERVCYVQCNFCSTILAVSVPSSSMFAIVTVRCGHCANLLTVNIGAPPLQHLPLPISPPYLLQRQDLAGGLEEIKRKRSTNASSSGSSSNSNSSTTTNKTATSCIDSAENHLPHTPPIRPPEKKQRVPSAYNRFIKEEIQRIKGMNPDITHREAFSLAAKNWAHFPRIRFGVNLEAESVSVMKEHTITPTGSTKHCH